MAIQAAATGLNLLGNGAGNAPQREEKQKRESSKLWLNVGYYVDVPQADGSTKRTFISTALGIPVEHIPRIEVKSNSSPEWKAMAQAKNDMLDELLKLGSQMAPGEGKALPVLAVEIQRVNEVDTTIIPAGQNPFSMANAVKL